MVNDRAHGAVCMTNCTRLALALDRLADRWLVEVFEAEAEARRQRRIARLRRAARLPPGKTFETLDAGRLPLPIVQRLQELATGTFLETATNVLGFGLPGVGKSHAERYERRTVMVTSNLVFSQWDRIFRDQMATAAAIDRLAHHAVLLEFDVPSYRTDRSPPTPPAPAPRSSRRGRAPGPWVPRRRRKSGS